MEETTQSMSLLCSAWRNAVTCLLLVAVLTDAVFEDEDDAEDAKSGPGVLEIKTMAAVDAMLDRVFFLLRFCLVYTSWSLVTTRIKQ